MILIMENKCLNSTNQAISSKFTKKILIENTETPVLTTDNFGSPKQQNRHLKNLISRENIGGLDSVNRICGKLDPIESSRGSLMPKESSGSLLLSRGSLKKKKEIHGEENWFKN